MRSVAQPEVLKSAAIASLATSLACYLEMTLWSTRPYPIWYMEAMIFLGGIVLWAFVFGWHTKYTHRPVFTLKLESTPYAVATTAGIVVAVVMHVFVDPSLRLRAPQDYPADFEQWLAMTLFTLAFSQLFLIFAPFAWLLRMFRNRRVAIVLTVGFGVWVLMAKTRAALAPIPPSLFATLLVVRAGMALLSLYFYLRGGLILVWWWGLVVQARHLLDSGI